MSNPILFLGDTTLQTAASYLAGSLANAGWGFDYLASDVAVSEEALTSPKNLIIISDYPAENISHSLQASIAKQVQQGTGLLMIGGWESYQGSGGNWSGTLVSQLLPVEIAEEDDRQNCDQPTFIRCKVQHPITNNLPWNDRPALIGGYNKVKAAENATVLLEAERYSASLDDDQTICTMTHQESAPLLVIDDSLPGRVAALMTDLAPHWVGPLVDWGPERVCAQADGAEEIEVGNYYMRFVQQLIAWVGRLDS
ncbi:MAG: hypothetical protein JKY95_06055 [Planctomycetaceae bacterium]|nr:hypothetical protein [Planctomycetaceae bacterium]